jgi:hypothetical protein
MEMILGKRIKKRPKRTKKRPKFENKSALKMFFEKA